MPHKEVKITCKSSCGHHTLAGILTSPTNRAATELVHGEAQSVVVLLHGAMANKNSFYHKTLAANLADEMHCHVYRYDQVGTGESLDGGAGPDDTVDSDGYRECGPRNMMNGFHNDVDDVRAVVEMLTQQHLLVVACIIGHSRGGLLAHLFAARYGCAVGIRSVVGVNMRWNLSFWHELRERDTVRDGKCVLRWSNRGVKLKHTVQKAHTEEFMAIGDGALQAMSLISIPVLNIYGVVAATGAASASYDTGDAMLIDGVIPYADVEGPANAIRNHTLRFIEGVGHYVKEENAYQKLWNAIAAFLPPHLGKVEKVPDIPCLKSSSSL